jgi:hypothetical protein
LFRELAAAVTLGLVISGGQSGAARRSGHADQKEDEEVFPQRAYGRRCARPDVHLQQDGADVLVDGVDRHPEPQRNLPVLEAFDEQLEDTKFAPGQAVGCSRALADCIARLVRLLRPRRLSGSSLAPTMARRRNTLHRGLSRFLGQGRRGVNLHIQI